MNWNSLTFEEGVDEIQLWRPFTDRGFSCKATEVLVDCSIDAPERLLFMTVRDIKQIPNLDALALEEIMAYRAKFIRRPRTGRR